MNLELFIALRYLISRERSGLLSLITLISVGGVTVGVTALLIVISVMDGFDQDLVKKMLGIFSHIEVKQVHGPTGYYEELQDYDNLMERLKAHPDVVGASPVIQQNALIQADVGIRERKVGVMVMGIDPVREKEVTLMQSEENMLYGRPPASKREAMVGAELAKNIGLRLGQHVYILSKVVPTANGPMAKTSKLKIVGVFKTGWYQLDSAFLVIPLESAQSLFMMKKTVDKIDIKLRNAFETEQLRESLSNGSGDYLIPGRFYNATSWKERNQEFFEALELEKLAMWIILTLVVVVASFNIFSTMILVVSEKTKQIGILRSIGCSSKHVMIIFILQGTLIGFFGILFGVILGWLGCYGIEHWLPRYFELPQAVYGINSIPVIFTWKTTGIVCLVAFVFTVVASVLPAYQACRIKTVEALRYE